MGAFDAITAKLAEASGAQSIFVSGFVACGVEAGEPGVGALSQRDMFEHIRRVCRATSLLEFARAHNDLARAMSQLGKPLVAAIKGDAHADGFSLVMLCDLAVCAEDATLGLPDAAHGSAARARDRQGQRPAKTRAIELAASTRHANPDVISTGRDL